MPNQCENQSEDQSRTTALVTGAAGGIGRELIVQLLSRGCTVIALDRSRRLQDLDITSEQSARLHYESCDLADPEQVTTTLRRLAQQPIDYGVLAAGELHYKPAAQLTAGDIQASLASNFIGHSQILCHLAKTMAQKGWGNIVVVGSNADVVPRQGMAAYGASKAALSQFALSLGLEYARQGVRLNIVAPGSTRTPMQTGMWQDPLGEQQVIAGDLDQFKLGIPVGRIAEPSDVASLILYLLSAEARHIALQKIVIDGGATLGQ